MATGLGRGATICDCSICTVSFSFHIFPVHIITNGKGFRNSQSYTCKRIFPVHITKNYLQMANELLHTFFPYKVSNSIKKQSRHCRHVKTAKWAKLAI